MIICFNCTAETKDELDQLIAIGSYRDYGEAIAASIKNQILMEQEVATRGPIVINNSSPFPQQPLLARASVESEPAKAPVAAKADRKPAPPRKGSIVAGDAGNGD